MARQYLQTLDNKQKTLLVISAASALGVVGIGGVFALRWLFGYSAPTASSDFQQKVVAAANRALTWADYDGWCTGYVASIFRNTLNINIANSVSNMAALAKRIGAFHSGPPRPGDIVFFGNTWDSNKDGFFNDPYTHVGVIMSVDANGTAKFGHGNFGSAGRTISYLNLNRPNDSRDENGNIINTSMRVRGSLDFRPYLAGALVQGFATVRPEDAHLWKY